MDTEDDASSLSIASLTLDVPLIPFQRKRRVPSKPFPFLQLPSEIRIKVYRHFFDDDEDDHVLDLAPSNYKRFHRKLGIMRVSRQVHDEATHYFYSTRTFRIFPTFPGRHFKTKRPLLARLKPNQRRCIRTLELRLGPGWNSPPRGWTVNEALGLEDCTDIRRLCVLVECDPSDSVFKGFRRAEGFYEAFSRNLLSGVIDALPSIGAIEFDAWSSVKKKGAMMRGLIATAEDSPYPIRWGPLRGWTDGTDNDDDVVESKIIYVDGFPRAVPLNGQNVTVSA